MSKKTLSRFITILLVAVLAVLGLGKTMVQAIVPAEGPFTNVIITKVDTKDEAKNMSYEQIINGVDVGTYFTAGKVMPGVSFTYYSVTPGQLATMTDNPAAYVTAAQVEALEGVGTGTATVETNSNGKVDLNLAEGNYWFVENTKGTIASSTAVPFGLALPFTNEAGTGYLPVINVYPKNTIKDANPDVEKDVDESNVAIGDINTWTVSLDIPDGIEDYAKFSFYDDIDSRLDFLGTENVVATATDITLIKGTDYTVNHAAPRLNVEFTKVGREKLALADSEKVEISFETKVNDTAIMGQEIENSATIEFDNGFGTDGENTPEDLPEVHTGGKAFVKIDPAAAEDEQALAGAEFEIKNGAGEYVNVGENGVITFVNKNVEEDANPTVFVSDANGKFEVKGLPYGDYTLVETKAPTGYALPTNPETTFVVDAGSYYTNLVEIEVGTEVSTNEQNVVNRKLTIPQTGGFGTMAFTVIGALLMIFSFVSYKKINKKPTHS
jgi:fimbrial isopeptide formation D2 family protein/LPXTG-motif cell wall-anchored protein